MVNVGSAWLLCITGGALMGSYPVFIKVPRVVAAHVNPMIFQAYKSLWVFLLGWMFLLVNYLRAKPLFVFSWWAVAAAALWVPSGFATIAAVSMCGVATTAVFTTCVNSMLQFLAGLMLDQAMKTHGESETPLAPVYMAGVVLGMIGLILSPRLRCGGGNADGTAKLNSHAPTESTLSMSFFLEDASVLLPEETKPDSSGRKFMVGVFLAMFSGMCGAMKAAVKNFGSMQERGSDNAEAQFSLWSSWMISFGVGCAVVTPFYLALFGVWQKGIKRQELPSIEFPVMKTYGFFAGAIWFAAYMCLQGANDVGGQGAMGPAGNASQLITAGLWGLLYYREIKGRAQITCWVLCALWTVSFAILLSTELEEA